MNHEILPDKQAVAQRAAELIIQHATATQTFTIALSGGSTPKALYELLTQPPFRQQLPWNHIHWLFGDERHVDPDHEDSNYRMARLALFDPAHVAPQQQHPIILPGMIDKSSPEEIASLYEQRIRTLIPGEPTPTIDLVLLGLGDDTHTASLFPHTQALNEQEKLVAANHVPQLDTWRLTITQPLINAARHRLLLVTGADKSQALKHLMESPIDIAEHPAQFLRDIPNTTILTDSQAAKDLTP